MSASGYDRVWLITGCSTGFGRQLAERVFAAGEKVVATARSVQALYDMGRDDEERILRLPLDVCDAEQVASVVTATIERFGRIDVLVNNAGYGYFGTQEEGELSEVRNLFETNVIGLVAATQGVLPHMRERRHGTIVNLSSVSGKMTTPRGGFYQASKWAVEALSEALYLEVAGFGIRVAVLEPGSYETDFGTRSARLAAADQDPSSPYAELRARWRRNVAGSVFPHRQDAREVIDAIIDVVNADIPFVRLPVGADAAALIARRAEMGESAFVEWMRKTAYGKEE